MKELRNNGRFKPKTNKQFTNEVYNLVGDDYVFLEDYINAKTHITCKHNISECGYTWKIIPNSFLQGSRCPVCTGCIKTSESFAKEVYEIVEDEYVFLDEYINSYTKILCRHNICGYSYKVRPHNFLQGDRCPRCMGYLRKTNKEFADDVYELVKDEYVFLEKYVNDGEKILCKHNVCNSEYFVTPNNFLRGKRCPVCFESKGEKTIRGFLEDNNILFKREYSFDGLVGIGGNLLRFDFALFNNKKNLICLIEYDGEFHFKKFYEDQNYETIQIHDKRKNRYCKDNDIPLLRIPYWEFDNIEDILINELSERWGEVFE